MATWDERNAYLAAAGDPATNAAYDALLASRNGTGPARDLLRRWTITELLAEPDHFSWLAKGLLVDPTYGQIGGELKTLKSVINTFITIGVASGTAIFDHFDVGDGRPVVAYVGEGGRRPFGRRLRRIARAMGVDLEGLPLFPVFDVAPLSSDVFRETLARDLREIGPALVSLDPLYVYHGTATRAADLHAEGALLGALSAPCIDAGATLLVTNHFNKNGAGMGLSRITMSGSGEWADSWVLLAHRADADVENGVFRLRMDVGSRQWGGTSWELDLTLGRFDLDLGEHEGEITWDLRRAGGAKQEQGADRILEVVAAQPYRLAKEELAALAGGNRGRTRELIDSLVAQGRLAMLEGIRQTANGRTRKTWLYGPKSDNDPTTEGRSRSLRKTPEDDRSNDADRPI